MAQHPTSHHPDSPVAPPLHNRESHNNYGGIVDVNRLSQSQREQLDTMIIQQYHALCNTTEDPSAFVSTPPIPTIKSLSQSTISSLGTRGSWSSTVSSGTTASSGSHSGGTHSGTTSSRSHTSGRNVSTAAPMALSTTTGIDPPAPLTTVIDPPSPQNLSNVFAASGLNGLNSSISTSSMEYKRAWRRAQSIKESILAAGDTTEECSQALSLALNHASMTPIVAITGAIVPKQFASLHFINRSKRQNYFSAPPQMEANNKDKHEVVGVQQLLKCSIATAYRRRKHLSTKRAHLIAALNNTDVKWSIKPRGIHVKKVSKDLRARLLQWIMKNPNVRQSPITTRDTLIIKDVETGVKRSVPKLLLECSMRQLHSEMIAPPDQGGLQWTRHNTSNDVIISDTMLRSLVLPELRPMTDCVPFVTLPSIFKHH
eukprot:scaffold123312_cov32-Attheya_sp.AAC.1